MKTIRQLCTKSVSALHQNIAIKKISAEWKSCVAAVALQPNAVIATFVGKKRDVPSRYSIQITDAVHMEFHDGPEYTNHSCDPNAVVRINEVTHALSLVALKPIAANEDITFNYNTTEWDMDEKFECSCGNCQGKRTIGGAKYLSRNDRLELLPQFTPAILRHVCRQVL